MNFLPLGLKVANSTPRQAPPSGLTSHAADDGWVGAGDDKANKTDLPASIPAY